MMKEDQLYELCKDAKFDEKLCVELIDDVPLNKIIENYNTTFLNTAFIYENFKMFKILLEKGADPNFYAETDGPVLWDLQYGNDFEISEDKQLALVKLVLDHGADPNIAWENETLMEYILWKVFNEVGDDNWEYIIKFFVYLIAYGGKLANGMPIMYQTIDKDKLNEYEFFFTEDRGRGEILRNGERVAYI